jgi:hypothetical protein
MAGASGNIGRGHVLRVCDLCGGVDDHPRHVNAGQTKGYFATPPVEIVHKVLKLAPADQADRLLAALLDPSSSDRHYDCCREAGCPSGSCDLLTQGAEDRRGAALLKHLAGLTDIAPDRDDIVKGE